MPSLATFADRVWYALHCLPRDSHGQPPSLRSLERTFRLPAGIFSKIALGARKGNMPFETMERFSMALRAPSYWLLRGGVDGKPSPTGHVPPRPVPVLRVAAAPTKRLYGHVAGWHEAVALALASPRGSIIPPEAFLAASNMPVHLPVDQITPPQAIAVACFCWEFLTPAEQMKYSTMRGGNANAGRRAATLRKRTK